ncbi:MAG: hypothetical protein QM725_04090 [Lacibacter sp.]
MKTTFTNRINNDLRESNISWKIILFFIPVAFGSYLFHEFGHWISGELSGNKMTMGLNNAAPQSGMFLKESHALWSAIGGPAFTIFQALLFLIVTWATKSVYAYSVVFFAAFLRFFSILFGGISLQDEARIAGMLGVNQYFTAALVLAILFLITWQSTRLMKLNMKAVGYFTVLSTFAILLVIKVDDIIR